MKDININIDPAKGSDTVKKTIIVTYTPSFDCRINTIDISSEIWQEFTDIFARGVDSDTKVIFQENIKF